MADVEFTYLVDQRRFVNQETGYEIGMMVIKELENKMLIDMIYKESGLIVDDFLLDAMRSIEI